MNNNFNILRLCCLMQDRDSQDLKRTALSIIFEILFENNNSEIKADLLFLKTNEKFSSSIERDFFDSLLQKSDSFEIVTTDSEPLIKLTNEKFSDIDKNVSEYSIEPHIVNFLERKNIPASKLDIVIDMLFQSIYENIYTFKPTKIESIIPQNISNKHCQADLDIFNDFLEFEEPNKNRSLYNQFAKAIEFAILTSGKGVSQFSENMYKDKCYLLDTNIIFRLIGVGGVERQNTTIQLLKDCIKQGIGFEYTYHTLMELNKKLEQSVIEIQRAERSQKIEIIEEVLEKNPIIFNDDFITQYCRLRIEKKVNSPEQYEIEMKAKFKALCVELKIGQANHSVKVENYERDTLANSLIKRRKVISEYYRYSNNSAKVDAFNVLYVRKRRGLNNYNYADVKSFYLTTDRGLNRILSIDSDVLIPETILPSQLFIIHNPLSQDSSEEPDYKTFFRFLKRRTSEFKLKGKDVINYITQARTYTTDPVSITSLIEAYSDQRYRHSIKNALVEHEFISFKDYTLTYFDKKNNEFKNVKTSYENIIANSEFDFVSLISDSKKLTKYIDLAVAIVLIPLLAMGLKLVSDIEWYFLLSGLVFIEIIKYFISSKTKFLNTIWANLFKFKAKRSSYYKLSKDSNYIQKGLDFIKHNSDGVYK